MTTEEIAKQVVHLTTKQAWREAVDTLYGAEIVSVEAESGPSGSPEMHGLDAIYGKIDWWTKAMEVHDCKVSGPFVAHDRFVVQYDMDVTDRESGKRFQMSEVGVYTVHEGKIVREEFLPRIEG